MGSSDCRVREDRCEQIKSVMQSQCELVTSKTGEQSKKNRLTEKYS